MADPPQLTGGNQKLLATATVVLGYAFGALGAGIIADVFGIVAAIASAGLLTFLSGVVVAAAMQERRHVDAISVIE